MENKGHQTVAVVSNYRHKIILERLNTNRSISTAELSTEFGVSKITIRRDLEMLAGNGYLLRVRAGAIRGYGQKIDFFLIKKTVL